MRRTSPAYLDGEESGHGRVARYIGRGGERDRAKSRGSGWSTGPPWNYAGARWDAAMQAAKRAATRVCEH